jgi:aspartyl-tRNA(Asn)/glutamyl-tRNA(Gln) amidotransferase subunit B
LPAEKGPKEVANWLLGEVSRIINDKGIDMCAFSEKVAPERLVKLLALIQKGELNAQTAKAVLGDMFETGRDAASIMAEKGLGQISDTRQIEIEIEKAIAGNAPAVADYRAGKPQALKFLVGQVMRATRGQANPNVAGDLLKKKLEEG